MKYICPLIVVKDIKRSREFYENILKLKVKYDYGENVTYEGDFAIHLQSHYEGLINGKEVKTGSNDFELYFDHDNIDEIAALIKTNNITLIHEAREEPWRQRVIRFRDPDNHIIEVGESVEYLCFRLSEEGMDIKTISSITYMPESFVEESIIAVKKREKKN